MAYIVRRVSNLGLRIGRWTVRLDGLDDALDAALRVRWGPFVTGGDEASAVVRLRDGGPRTWLEAEPGEPYRLEATLESGAIVVRSHHFELAPDGQGRWRMEISRDPAERADRLVENAVRYLAARGAVEAGGLAFHGAAVRIEEEAHLLLGPSGSGKTTAVGLLAPAVSLGDDFAVAAVDGGAWVAPSTPFDNLESVPAERPTAEFRIAGIWRLFPSPEDRVERPLSVLAVSSLVTCAAMPWAMPDLSARILENATRLLHRVPYAHLHFGKTSDLGSMIRAGTPSPPR